MEATTAVSGCAATVGRRERKKQRTREALVDAAFRLFQEKGFDATTVEEIADAVDVSARTFFRYFSSKEDVVLTFQEEQFRAMVDALAARPADEPVLTSLRNAAVAVVRACEQGEYGFDPERFGCIQQIMENSSAVFGRSLEHAQKKHALITRVIADRMGADPGTDLRPHVVASAVNAAFQTTFELVGTGRYTRFSDALSEIFALLEEGIDYPADAARPSSAAGVTEQSS